MITNFKKFNLVKETPDWITLNGETIYWNDEEGKAKPFFVIVNSDHTKVERLYLGGLKVTHYKMRGPEESQRSYAGRIFLGLKIITFWTYPNPVLFKSIIKSLEERTRRKIFNNKWKVEIIRQDDGFKINEFDPDKDDYYFSSRNEREDDDDIVYEFIPVEDYVGSEDNPEELRIQHLMNWQEKEEAKKQGLIKTKGFGSDRTAWDRSRNIKYRQTIYQENKKY